MIESIFIDCPHCHWNQRLYVNHISRKDYEIGKKSQSITHPEYGKEIKKLELQVEELTNKKSDIGYLVMCDFCEEQYAESFVETCEFCGRTICGDCFDTHPEYGQERKPCNNCGWLLSFKLKAEEI